MTVLVLVPWRAAEIARWTVVLTSFSSSSGEISTSLVPASCDITELLAYGTRWAVVRIIARYNPPQAVQVTSAWPVPVATQTLAAPITLNDGDTAHGGILLEALRGKIFPATGGRLILRLVCLASFGELMADEELPAHDGGIAV